MSDLPANPMMSVNAPYAGTPTVTFVYADFCNAADLDLGYEVAFPFLTSADDSDS